MRIVTWNCNGGLRNKFDVLSELDADIYVVQECENPLKYPKSPYDTWAKNHLWIGDNDNKGVGVFAKESINLSIHNWDNTYINHKVKYFLPCRIMNKFNLLAVWNHKNNSPNFGYIGQFWKYLQFNKNKFNEIIIVGDFNSNSIWDQWDRWWNHSDVVNELKEIGITSFYHKLTNEFQGKETIPTFYLHRKIEKSYHIDYFFGNNKFISRLNNIEIGKPDKWLIISDHMPIICDLDLES